MANTALVKVREKLKATGGSLSKVRGTLKGTEGMAGAGKAAATGVGVGLLVNLIERKLPRLHEKLPQSVIVGTVALAGAAMTRGDTSRYLAQAGACAVAIAVDDGIEGMSGDGDDTKDGE